MENMRKSYKFRLRPTARQHISLEQMLKSHCDIYNAALEHRNGAYSRSRKSITYVEQAKELTQVRAEDPNIERWSAHSEQHTLRRLDKAFKAFFSRVKKGKTPGYPRFKSLSRFDTVTWTHGNGSKFKQGNQIYLQGIGTIKVTAHRKVEGVVKEVSVKREGRKWYLILSCDEVPKKDLPKTGAVVGIDLGINVYVATSDGKLIENPRWMKKFQSHLGYAQQKLAKAKKKSNSRKLKRETIAKIHRKVSNQRKDFQFKTANKLVLDYDFILHENLNIKGMMKSNSGTVENPGKNVAQKTGLNRSIQDAAWSSFLSILRFKAEEAGKEVRGVNPKNTSITCLECDYVSKENRDGIYFQCQDCGFKEHADIVGATNVLRTGLVHLFADTVLV